MAIDNSQRPVREECFTKRVSAGNARGQVGLARFGGSLARYERRVCRGSYDGVDDNGGDLRFFTGDVNPTRKF